MRNWSVSSRWSMDWRKNFRRWPAHVSSLEQRVERDVVLPLDMLLQLARGSTPDQVFERLRVAFPQA